MPKEKIRNICEELDNYLVAQSRVEPFSYLYGETNLEGDLQRTLRDLSTSSQDSLEELNKILQRFSQKLRGYVDGEFEFKDMENGDPNGFLFFKMANQEDLSKINSLTETDERNGDFMDYLKGRFKNNFFVIEINLNDSGSKKLIFFRAITPTFYAKKSKFIVSPFSNRKKISFIDNKKTLILDENFDIVARISDANDSYFFITNRKKFEDLFDYHEKYKEAYANLTNNLNFVEWEEEEPSLHIQRACYSIANFSRLTECINLVKERLCSGQDNDTKKALVAKGISFTYENGQLKVFPQGARDTLALLKIIRDGVAKTDLLQRSVLGGDFEELT